MARKPTVYFWYIVAWGLLILGTTINAVAYYTEPTTSTAWHSGFTVGLLTAMVMTAAARITCRRLFNE